MTSRSFILAICSVSDNLAVPTATKSSVPAPDNVSNQITPTSDPVNGLLQNLRKAVTESELDISLHLNPDSLLELARRARDARLIPRKVVEDLEMMHPCISMESKCRYVMMYICKAIRADGDSCEGNYFRVFVELLYRYIDCNQLEQCISQRPSDVGRESSQARVFQFDVLPETQLHVETHLNKLYEVLMKYSHLWEKIGMALNFSPSDFERIKAVRMNDISMCLYDILSEWLLQLHYYLKPPTFGTLAEVLYSPLVNCGRLEDDVRKALRAAARPRSYKRHYIGERTILMSTSHDLDIKLCKEEVAVLLEFRVKNPCSIEYKWNKDGEPLEHSDLEHNNSILCVRIKNVRAEGEYRCISSFGEEMIESEVIKVCVRTMLCKYASCVRDKYQFQPEIKSDTWHEVHQHTYINLAVVGEGGRLSQKCYQQTIRGDADDVFQPKASINYQDAFRDIKYGDRVLVVGRPGSGKTTLVHRISQDWAKGSILTKFKILFLIPLRGFHNTNINLSDLVKCYINCQEVNEVCKYIEEQEGLGVCFILDGLDEYNFDKDEKVPNFISRLIRGTELPCATVIVASRPAAVTPFTRFAKRFVEVLGFFKEQIEEYIDSYQFSSNSKSLKLRNYLKNHSNIQHMCYLPVQALMVCFLFDICEDDLPNTETGIYTEFTKQTVMRAIHRKKDESCQLYYESLNDLQEIHKKSVSEICGVAFEMTRYSKQVVSQIKAKDSIVKYSLGLVTIDHVLSRCGFKESYSFCHLTFQEFLSAYHISSLEVEKQLRIIKECGPMKHMYMVFKFYCGLVTFEVEDVRFKTLIEVAQFNTLHKVHCCFESQQPSTCDLVADRNIIIIDEGFKTPTDFTCLGYVVSKAVKNPVRILKLSYDVVVDEDCCEEFKRIVNSSKYAVDIIEFSDTRDLLVGDLNFVRACSPFIVYCESEYEINSLLEFECPSKVQSLPSVEIICFSYLKSHINLQNLQEDLKKICPQLRTLGLPGLRDCIKMKVPSIKFFSVWFTSLSTFTNQSFQRAEVLRISYDLRCKCCDRFACTHLTLFNCDLNDETAALLAEGLRFNSGVKVLKLVANDIGDEGAAAIAASINCRSSLRHLDLSLNKITDTGAAALMKWIESDCGFNLRLCGNNMSDSFVAGVRKGDVRELFQVLEITDIGDDGLVRIDSIMNKWTLPLCTVRNLQSLYLQSSRKSIGDIKLVRNMLPRLVSLRSLSFVDMNIRHELDDT